MDMVHILLIVVLVLCSLIGHLQGEDSCHGLHSDFSHHFASKTPYRYVANHDTNPVTFEGKYACFFKHDTYLFWYT